MAYLGIHRQTQRNNRYSLLLLLAFPLLLLALLFTILYFSGQSSGLADTWQQMLPWLPFVLAGVAIWFLIAWWGHGLMIRLATGSKPLQRQEHMRIYNLLENLCISQGMPMPKLLHIDVGKSILSPVSKTHKTIIKAGDPDGQQHDDSDNDPYHGE